MTSALNVTPIRGRIPQWTFAERARKVRRDLGLTQVQMAAELEVGLKAYSAWESGKNSPEDIPSIAVKFERVSGVPRTWFLGWSDDSPIGGGGSGLRTFLPVAPRLGLEPRTYRSTISPGDAEVIELPTRTDPTVEHDYLAPVTQIGA